MKKLFNPITFIIAIILACFITRRQALSEAKLHYDLGNLKWFFLDNDIS